MVNQWEPLDLVFQALADPTRRAIVEQLTRGAASVSTLAAPLPMSLPAVLQHLRVLQESGVIRSSKTGRVRTCEIEPAALDAAGHWIHDRRAGWERRLDRLGAHLDDTAEPLPAGLDDPDPTRSR